MLDIFYSVLPIFLIAVLGCIIKHKWLQADEFWRGLEKLSFYVLFPAMLFQNTAKVNLDGHNLKGLISGLLLSNLIISISLVIYQKRSNYDKIQFTSIFQGATRYNSYIFFALGAGWLGNKGMEIIASVAPYMLILTNVSAIVAFYHYIPPQDSAAKKGGFMLMLSSIFGNPFILSSVGGMIFNYCGFKLNQGLFNTLETIASSAFAVGMLIVGAGIRFKLDHSYISHIALASAVKLVATPIVTFIILWFFGVYGLERSIGILFSCLPCATSSYLLSRQMGGDGDTMSAIITFSTIFSILSLSLLVYILG